MDTDYEQYAILRVSLQWQNNEFYVFKYFSKPSWGGGWTAAAPGDPLAQAPVPPPLPSQAPTCPLRASCMPSGPGDLQRDLWNGNGLLCSLGCQHTGLSLCELGQRFNGLEISFGI